MARRGRPRKSGLREPNGRLALVAEDRGTVENQRRRAWLAQGADPALTSYPLGILLANDAISDAQHQAGCRYAWLFSIAIGRASTAAQSFDRLERGTRRIPTGALEAMEPTSSDDWRAAREREFREAAAELVSTGRQVKALIDETVIYQHCPRWLFPKIPTNTDVTEARALLLGLDTLGRHFRTKVTFNA
ncbi:hypothetical protein [Oceanibacterium hippocampi]|uniref:Uncharacterized protein n=1 Tax=Oceanibacterium hippocampi TaxID=745714 RepID=A0A1Y5S7K2_9PROT|nr:hypothetical protein [Oceanibacterium hippocampi]SLN31952.1 hypothetical protein OCH7691_01163 [Oceanibacterium hippocampi]